MIDRIDVLDNGYVALLRVDGKDIDIENAARASFNKSVEVPTEGFIERLAAERHMSPFRHVGLWFEFKFPGDVRGQFLKHIVGNCVVEEATAWNEQSNRGKRTRIDFHYPIPRMPIGKWGQGAVAQFQKDEFRADLEQFYKWGEILYSKYLERGVAPENCRKFLPFYGMYTIVRSRMSLEAAFHFWKLRQNTHAQLEIREYADAVCTHARTHFPISWSALVEGDKA